MGIIVDLQRSSITFSEPLIPIAPLDVVHNQLFLEMHSFTIGFGVSFDPDPKKGVGGTTTSSELWRMGIVQNLVYAMSHYEYENKQAFKNEFKNATFDSVPDTIAKPFYADPDLRKDAAPPTRPVADIWYTSQGYGELLSPYSATGVATSNKPDLFDMWDQPTVLTRMRLKDGSFIKRAEHVVSFQAWLVARTPSTTHVLAHVPAFSLVYWLETDPNWSSKGKLSIDTPGYNYEYYAEKGITKRVNKKASRQSPNLQPALGNGGRTPVMAGVNAGERSNKWLRDNNLIPKSDS
jgi:hypothetical protein